MPLVTRNTTTLLSCAIIYSRSWKRKPDMALPSQPKPYAKRAARGRFPLMFLAGISLLAALWAGLVRIGWNWPAAGLLPAGQHGAFMVSGFLGTLISLERAVALRQN